MAGRIDGGIDARSDLCESLTMKKRSSPVRQETRVGVHLDFKGVQFKPSYLPQLIADLAGQGVNTILAEYEDVFPFDDRRGIDVIEDRQTKWTPAILKRFQTLAAGHGIEIIPLQQCLGHLEYVYRWKRYRSMALDRNYPSVVNIASPRARAMVFEMLEQVIVAHPDSRLVHLGMDEAHALVAYAQAKKQDVLELFLDHLEALCAICERHGKTPIIWSDMWEDHISPANLKRVARFKDRVILCPWDYGNSGERIASGRIAGNRVSRAWLQEPENPDAPTIGPGHTFIEDLPVPVGKVLGTDLQGRYFTSMFQADLWTRLGFRVLGASAVRCSTHLAVLPNYNQLGETIQAWSRAIRRTRQLGQIGTSWARGTSWCPPGYTIDLCWPLIGELARTMGQKPRPFFSGIPQTTVDRIIRTLGRCRADWRLELRVADEMERLAPQLRAHRYEWESMILMARVLALHRRAEYHVLEVDFFHANVRPIPAEWDRRLREQKKTLDDFKRLRTRVHAHFSKRYFGQAFEEWIEDLFGTPVRRFNLLAAECRAKKALARQRYDG
jgi:hypothetical protein